MTRIFLKISFTCSQELTVYQKKFIISTRAFQWLEIANNVENCHFWSTYHNRSFSTVFCNFFKESRSQQTFDGWWSYLSFSATILHSLRPAAHFSDHSKIFVALMITPTSFIDKKIFFNQVQDWNLDSIGYILISLNLFFVYLLIWPKSTITWRGRFVCHWELNQ